MTDDLIDTIATSTGSTAVHVDDVTEVALELAERLDGQLIEGVEEFAALAEERRRALAERAAAHTALELLARSAESPAEPVVVNDLAGLRSLMKRLDEADRLIDAAGEDARRRAGSASGLAVHPTSIRDAAADVFDARATVLERQQELHRLDEPDASDVSAEAATTAAERTAATSACSS